MFIISLPGLTFKNGIQTIKERAHLGKVIALGQTFDLFVFAILSKNNNEFMAGGVILEVIVLAFSTLLT